MSDGNVRCTNAQVLGLDGDLSMEIYWQNLLLKSFVHWNLRFGKNTCSKSKLLGLYKLHSSQFTKVLIV